jgi:tyrosine-protein kinase Etk/Wzc
MSASNTPSTPTGSLVSKKDITRIVSIARKNWLIPIIFLVVGAALGNFYTYRLVSVFGAKTQILLRSNDQISPGSVISDNSYYSSTTKTFVDNSNEKRVISSYDLIAQAIDRLDFGVSYFLVGRVRTEEIFMNAPFDVTVKSLSSDLYEQELKLDFLSSNSYAVTYTKNEKVQFVKGVFNKDLVTSDLNIMISPRGNLSNSQSGSMLLADYRIQIHSRDHLTKRYQSGLKVESPDYTNILEISVEDVIPARAVMFLDTLVQVYVENSIEQRLDINQNTLFFIDRQLGEVGNILNTIEDSLQFFREREAIFDIDMEGTQYFSQYIGYDSKKRNLQLESAALTDLEKYIRDNKDPQFLPPSAYFSYNDPFLDASVSDLYDKQIQYSLRAGVGTPDNPEMILLKDQIEGLKQDMLVYINNSRNALANTIAEVDKQMDTSISDIQGLPIKQRGLVNITRELKVNENLYLFLLQRKANTVISRASILPETKIIERARSLGVVKPDRDKIIYYFIVVSLIVALLVIAGRVLFFERIESSDELRAITNIPIAGEIIQYAAAAELKIAVDVDPKSVLAESFRSIRTNLQYMLADKAGGQIVVTSNSPGEGKTFCSINLAAILAKGGKRVILLELDLHKPRVQKGLDITSPNGFSTIAIGKCSVENAIIKTSIENLDVILSGPLPPNPSEIVVSPKLNEVLDYCRDHYEYTIIDTPPVGLISDALVLMKRADMALFVVNVRVAYRSVINQVLEMLEHHKVSHVSFILNNVKRKRSRYHYSRYGYGSYGGYGYSAYGGYGYGSYGGSYGAEDSGKEEKGKKFFGGRKKK